MMFAMPRHDGAMGQTHECVVYRKIGAIVVVYFLKCMLCLSLFKNLCICNNALSAKGLNSSFMNREYAYYVLC